MATPLSLTPQQELFVNEYLANGFAMTAAYRVAYPNASEKTVASNSYREVRKPAVRGAVVERIKERLGDYEELANRTLLKLEQIAFAERGDEYYASNAQLKALELIQKQLGLQTQNIKAQVEATTIIEINITGDENDEDTA